MALTRTRAQIRDEIYLRCDIPTDSIYIIPADMNEMINESIGDYYDQLVKINKDAYTDSDTISLVSGTAAYSLPSDFYRIRGVDYADGSEIYNLKRFKFAERNIYQNQGMENKYLRYRIVNGQIRFNPTPSSAGTITVWYIPTPPQLTDDAHTIETYSRMDEFVIVDVCLKIAIKQEEDPQPWLIQKEALIKRLNDMLDDLDDGSPDEITDPSRVRYGDRWPNFYNP